VITRRKLLAQTGRAAALWPLSPMHTSDAATQKPAASAAVGFRPLRFPRDHGAHPNHRIEWWYLTAWLDPNTGLQATIFRTSLGKARPSHWGSNQWLIGHAALIRRDWPKLIHEQTAWRCVESVAEFSTADLELKLPGWRMQRASDDRIAIDLSQGRLAMQLQCHPIAAPELQGQRGYSQKGPEASQFSHYYSRTQLRIDAQVEVDGKPLAIEKASPFAVAWFDHEWSDSLLASQAAGWDWFGLNLLDGSSWMAFRIRNRQAGDLWHSESGLLLETLQSWRSPSSGARYPVVLRVQSKRGSLILRALVPDQEIDARASTGNRYWEGAVTAHSEQGELIGRGYLELTGYDKPMRL